MNILNLLFCLVLLASCSKFLEFKNHRKIASQKTKTIFLGVDGLSKDYFDYAQNDLKLFEEFKSNSIHIAPFPSISDYSWNKIVKATDVYGHKGRIQHYEAAYYDRSLNKSVEDPREYFRRVGQENHYYSGAFQIFFNPYVESLLYFPTKKLPEFEFNLIKDEILNHADEDFTSALIASIDAISHTQAEIDDLLIGMDKLIKDLLEEHYKRGINAEVIIVSDHGQSFDFKIGEKPKELKVADVPRAITESGFNLKKSLVRKNDVAMPVLALGNYAPIYFKDIQQRETFANKLKKYPWFELGIFKLSSNKELTKVKIIGSNGSAILEIHKANKKFDFIYKPVLGNPLRVPESIHGKRVSSEESFGFLKKAIFPDSFHRIAETMTEEEAELPDMIITLNETYRVKGGLDQFTKMFRTHGSLHWRSSQGIVASTSEIKFPKYMRTEEILDYLGIQPQQMFKQNLNKGLNSNSDVTQESLQEGDGQIQTGAGQFNNKRIFGLINRFVNYSQYVLNIDSMEPFKKIFQGDMDNLTAKEGVSKINFKFDDVKKVNFFSPNDIAELMDIVLEDPDWKKIEANPKFIKLKEKMLSELKKLHVAKDIDKKEGKLSNLSDYSKYGMASKNLVMKQYSIPFLLNRALSFPEFDKIKDTRDVNFSMNFFQYFEEGIDYKNYFSNKDITKKLFSEIFNERQIVEDLEPQKVSTIYNISDVDDITFVYIPGIYNSIFNNEIFQMGLDSLRNDFGLRVIAAPVLSACDSNYNGANIVSYIKNDMYEREIRGQKKHKYFLLGYSKGAVDALYGLANAKHEFVKENIVGLLSIASPLQGTKILDKTDLPIMLLELIGEENIPEICKEKQWASKTITPNTAKEFFKKNGDKLSGLTRFYSISFESDIKDSHLWMQATKQIARFDEKNDGVVAVSDSKFPTSFSAIDLGEVNADHLAGITASHFPQKAFMQSLILSLQYLGAFNSEISREWEEFAKYNSDFTDANTHREKMKNVLAQNKVLEDIFSQEKDFELAKRKIVDALSGTPYATKDFKITTAGFFGDDRNKIVVEYEKDSNDFSFSSLFSFGFNASEGIDSVDDLVAFILEKVQKSGKDLLISEKQAWRNYPVSERERTKLPDNSLGYLLDERISLRKIAERMDGKIVRPMTPIDYPNGFSIIYDHQTPIQFREEYQFNYEDSSVPDADNNAVSGWISHLTSEGDVVAKMSSKNSSIRVTSFAMRFLAKDFKKIKLKISVTNNVKGADVTFGGSGKDDSAFQVWFTLRVNNQNTDRTKFSPDAKSMIFGYYWGDKIKNKELKENNIYENYYSKKNFLIAVLPEAKQYLIGYKNENMNKFQEYEFDFYDHLKKAFPDQDVDNVEVIGITFQHDSNDTKGDSEAFFKYLKFE